MKTKNIIIIASIIIALLVAIFIIQHKKNKRYFKQQEFSKTINITNEATKNRLDTILFVLAEKVFMFDTLNITIFPIPNIVKNSDLEYYAIVQKNEFEPHSYIIFINEKLQLEKLKLTLSHEFIHIQQYESEELFASSTFAIYKDEFINLKTVKYEDRTYEIEAFANQQRIYKLLNKLLY